jgi:hypothetical protein
MNFTLRSTTKMRYLWLMISACMIKINFRVLNL